MSSDELETDPSVPWWRNHHSHLARRKPTYPTPAASCREPSKSTEPAMKYVLFYEAMPDFRTKVTTHMDAHRALWKSFHDDGRLLMVGPFTDEPAGGALGVFSSRAAAEDFVRADPFVSAGIVARWTIREWSEVLVPEAR
jgi:uncharacterized protein YciI